MKQIQNMKCSLHLIFTSVQPGKEKSVQLLQTEGISHRETLINLLEELKEKKGKMRFLDR